MALRRPEFSFQIKSLHDSIDLDCAIYDNQYSREKNCHTQNRDITRNRGNIRGAIIAHPYAPLGGSSHDHVVRIVRESFLQNGYVVGAFDFRFIPKFFFVSPSSVHFTTFHSQAYTNQSDT